MRAIVLVAALSIVSPTFQIASAQPRTSSRRPGAAVSVPVPPRAEVIAEAQRLRTTMAVPVRGARLDAESRRRAAESFAWLNRAGHYYREDALVSAALMQTYGVLGDYYREYYPAAAWRAYVSANWWARRQWWYYTRTSELQRDMERYALAWATIAAANGTWFWRPVEFEAAPELEAEPAGERETALEPVEVPKIDEASLSADQREAWKDVRTQFVFISARVHQTRLLLDELTQRLKAQGTSLNARDGAIAVSMQAFLVDAADLARDHQFERSMEALKRADYERSRLKDTVGR